MCNCQDHNNCQCSVFMNEALIVSFPVMVKASLTKSYDRVVEFEASNEERDAEGDVILQSALLGGADKFLKSGHLDIDHYSELAKNPDYAFLNIKNGDDWIVGVPLDVKDLGDGRTGVKGEIYRNKDGTFDPERFKYDHLWKALQTQPPARYYASIYGFPGRDTEMQGCAITKGGREVCATRYLVKSFDWRSTALTRHPVNDSIKSQVKIITAKAFAAKMSRMMFNNIPTFSRDIIRKSVIPHLQGECHATKDGLSLFSMRQHYLDCDNLTYNMADLYALATRELLRNKDY